MSNLADFTTVQLTRELVRRARAERRGDEPKQYCDDCRNFVPWTRDEDPPDNYDFCGHHLSTHFHAPDDYAEMLARDWGFYRKNCSKYDPADIPVGA